MTKRAILVLFFTVLMAPAAAAENESVCVQDFAAVDRDGDGGITPGEADSMAAAEFAAMDADGDGHVTPVEFETCLGALHGTSEPERQVLDRVRD